VVQYATLKLKPGAMESTDQQTNNSPFERWSNQRGWVKFQMPIATLSQTALKGNFFTLFEAKPG